MLCACLCVGGVLHSQMLGARSPGKGATIAQITEFRRHYFNCEDAWVPRAAGARPRAASSERPEQLVYVAKPAEGDAAALSSTAVRAALARRDHAAAAAMLSPAAADLLLRPGAREHARFAADYQALGV